MNASRWPVRLTNDLKVRFGDLLFARPPWDFRPEELRELEQVETKDAFRAALRKFERLRGSDYDARMHLLCATLTRVAKYCANLEPVCKALEEATHERVRSILNGRELDQLRDYVEARNRIRRGAQDALEKLLAFYTAPRRINGMSARVVVSTFAHVLPDFETFRGIQAMLARLKQDSYLNVAPRLRRARRGQPGSPWLKTCREALRAAGIRAADQQELLQAVGLVAAG